MKAVPGKAAVLGFYFAVTGWSWIDGGSYECEGNSLCRV